MKPNPITLARVLNDAAPPVWSRTGPPRPIRANRHPEEHGPWIRPLPRPKPKGTLTDPDLLAALATADRIAWQAPAVSNFNPEPCPPARTLQTEKKRFLSFSPPRFKIPTKGPNAGQPVEEKMCIRLLTRTVVCGAKRWESTATLKGGTPKLPATADGTAFSKVYQDLRARYGPLQADKLQNFLRFAEYA